MSDEPETERPAEDDGDLGELDFADPLKRPDDLPGLDPTVPPPDE
jgi:hypothetical protein